MEELGLIFQSADNRQYYVLLRGHLYLVGDYFRECVIINDIAELRRITKARITTPGRRYRTINIDTLIHIDSYTYEPLWEVS